MIGTRLILLNTRQSDAHVECNDLNSFLAFSTTHFFLYLLPPTPSIFHFHCAMDSRGTLAYLLSRVRQSINICYAPFLTPHTFCCNVAHTMGSQDVLSLGHLHPCTILHFPPTRKSFHRTDTANCNRSSHSANQSERVQQPLAQLTSRDGSGAKRER